ncbi:hypothetical protein KK141_22730 [Dyella sp. LX-66]|uniref:hypothetical protein n=1 Tax=unclassified Dyella TaxID=2634549 RepID=UPI001BE0D523|nr:MULTISPECIES: hypothetical protein [unclassified Dyella]MBT2118491.1 hypothetical protein [Dyella sp. LX-1]MBT2142379.1 hypothetical protein [Dyella sp. LX-66]
MVEFQPSGWDKGSYLNVGACWLWYEKDFLSFDAGSRVQNFQAFVNDEQFALAAKELAEQAAQEVIALRERFPSPSHVQAWLTAKPPVSIWDHYHVAVSAGLAGATEQSKRAFADVISSPVDRSWAAEIKRRSIEFMRCLELGDGFEAEILDTVRRARGLLGLPVAAPGRSKIAGRGG